MKRSLVRSGNVATATLFYMCLVALASVQAAETVVTQWTPHELRFQASQDHNWHACPVQVMYQHKDSGEQLTIDAYWDGGKQWAVRFAPTKPGVWEYRATSSDHALDGHSGKIDCVAATEAALEANANLRGQVRVFPGGRYFTYADGTPFLGLAEQFWDFNVASWMALEDVDAYLADRKAKGFNIVQVRYARIPAPNEGGWAFPKNTGPEPGNGDFSVLNAEFFKALDQRFHKCFKAGFVVAGHPLWIGFDTKMSVEDAKRLQRYLLARYGAYNIIWSISGEFDKAFNAEREGKIKWRDTPQVKGIWNNGGKFDPDSDCEPWRELGRDAARHNPYGVPISVHPNVGMGGRRSSGDWFHRDSWLDHHWIQTYKAVHLVPERVQRDYKREPIKPVFFSEGIREGDQTEAIQVGAYGVRWEAWQALLSGATIHTYRHFGVYMEKWHTEGKCGPLLGNLSATSSLHVGIAAEFLRKLPWWKLRPAREQLQVDGKIPEYPKASTQRELDKAITMAAIPGEVYLVYIPKHNLRSDIVILDLKPGTYQVVWLNPRSGARYLATDTLLTLGEKDQLDWHLPQAPDEMDWLFVLRSTSGENLPSL